ncbi:hypothetical protein B0A50_08099 [Salinomyces thailandicus]|uniref:DUF1763-domain-containing protein n=1 Tax=Salinomyces thailandicus TaxID=706561 RepID=A0A4U0TK45_9PEZI|nr:hypothetical protein B0A50_08099 [Salinomyces thailandica]
MHSHTPLPPNSHKALFKAYRHLYTHALRAVQYSKPARFVCRDHLRAAFRDSPAQNFQPDRINRTLEFLDGAAKSKGIEHKVLKNLVFVWWEKSKLGQRP